MTEKRFTFSGTYDEPVITDGITGKDYPTEENSLIVLLNELADENEQLKDQLKNLRRLVNEVYMEGSE